MSEFLQTPYRPEAGVPPCSSAEPEPAPDVVESRAPQGGRPQASGPDARAWSRERDAVLIEMWTVLKLSASEIGRRLGISKNAVIGRSHRLRLPARPSPIIRQSAIAKPARAEPTAPARRLEPLATPAAVAVAAVRPAEPLDRLQSACRWPIGHPGTAGFAFCGQDCTAGKPYCEEHCRRAYVRRPIVCAAEAAAM